MLCCQCGNASRCGQLNNWRGAVAGLVAGYFGGAAVNKFNIRYHTIKKEILKYLKHYSKFHEVFII